MKHRSKTFNLITVLSVLFVLVGVFSVFTVETNSWFTVGGRTVQMTTTVQGLDVQIYQGTSTNVTFGTGYVTLSQEILPDTQVSLDLRVKNNSSKSVNVKFKFEVYVGNTQLQNVSVNINTTNFAVGTGDDAGYYVYSSNPLAQADGIVQMMTGFTIPFASFSGYNCESVQLLLTVVAGD